MEILGCSYVNMFILMKRTDFFVIDIFLFSNSILSVFIQYNSKETQKKNNMFRASSINPSQLYA